MTVQWVLDELLRVMLAGNRKRTVAMEGFWQLKRLLSVEALTFKLSA